MNTLSLAMIVRDEEKTLPRLFESIKGIFDEIVVVDTGSTDKTVEICEKAGAKIFHFEWIDDFAAARNFSFSKATSNWIMWLDADDVLKPVDRDMLIGLKSRLGDADVYMMWYDYFQDEFGSSVCKFRRERILRASKRPVWKEMIHEHIDLSGWREAEVDITITHKRIAEACTQDKGRNVRILEKALKKDPQNKRLQHYYGKELYYEGRHEELIKVLEPYVEKGDYHENIVASYYWIAMSYAALGKNDKVIETCLKGIGFDPRWAEFYCLIGDVYFDKPDWGRAIQWYEIAASCPVPKTWGTVYLEKYEFYPRKRLALAYNGIGDVWKAYEWNEAGLTFKQDSQMIFNKRLFEDHLYDRLSTRRFNLNLGSGQKQISGWDNCDLYMGDGIKFRMNQNKIPFHDGAIHAIRSEHALEHSDSHYVAAATVKEWARAIRPRGYLHLMVPDLEECCRNFVAAPDIPKRDGEKYSLKDWYKYTIYGIQQKQGHEPDAGQYHTTGFTQASLGRLLEENGFTVTKNVKYDGYGTPSIEVEAFESRKPLRVAWLLRSVNESDPSTRIRRLNMHRWLSEVGGVHSQIVAGYQDKDAGAILNIVREFDAVVFSYFSDLERQVMDKLRMAGIAALADYNEDLTGEHPEVARCLQSATMIVCCSEALYQKALSFGRATCIDDAFEVLQP